MRFAALQLLVPCCLATLAAAAPAADPSALFDKPLAERHIPLPHDRYNPQAKPMLSCFYYPKLMVKQEDRGEIGAARLSITFVPENGRIPACSLKPGKGEVQIDGRNVWSGYFMGVKDEFVFFTSGDGSNGGDGLAVFDINGTKLFSDLISGIHGVDLLSSRQSGSEHPAQARLLGLNYRRTYVATCSLMQDGAQCWEQIRQLTGLEEANPPDCRKAYSAAHELTPAESWEAFIKDNSVIEYDVEIKLDNAGTILQLRPASSGADNCHPAD